jgi:hypothetical protein
METGGPKIGMKLHIYYKYRCRDRTLKYAPATSFHILSNSLITNRPTIQH